jgi:hypothetical protein
VEVHELLQLLHQLPAVGLTAAVVVLLLSHQLPAVSLTAAVVLLLMSNSAFFPPSSVKRLYSFLHSIVGEVIKVFNLSGCPSGAVPVALAALGAQRLFTRRYNTKDLDDDN